MNVRKSMVWMALIVALSLVALPACGVMNALSVPGARAFAPAAAPATPTPQPTAVAPSVTGGALAALEGALERVYQDVSPSVVYIEVLQTQQVGSGLPFFRQPLPQQQPEQQYQQGSGSGFVWDQDGHIVTNNHVVDGADKIEVTFSDGTTVQATVVGTDPASDMAVLKVEVPAAQLHPVRMADSTLVKVGQLAIAIGNPFGLENTMTVGIVSALGRSLPAESNSGDGTSYTIPDVIQTDAPINPGNSGGVLLNDQGEVIGVTSAIVSPVRASAGVGFAVPAAIVQNVVPVLITKGSYEHPWLGISGTTLDANLAQAMGLEANQRGALVIEVVSGSPAEQAGLQGSDRQVTIDGQQRQVGGDVIVALDGQPVKTFDDLVAYLFRSTEVGQKVTLTMLRDGREQQVEVTIAARPVAQEQASSAAGRQAVPAGSAWLGIAGVTVSPEVAQAAGLAEDQQGVLIEEVTSGSPADKAGLQGSTEPVTVQGQRLLVGGDVITAWDGHPVTQIEQLRTRVGEAQVGQEVTLTVLRDGEQVQVQVTLAARPTE